MSKNLLLGTILGGAATYVAWKCLSDKQKNDIKKNVGSYVTEVADASTDYALNALDIIDEKLAEHDASEKLNDLSNRFNKTADKVKDKASHVVDHFTNDDFDKETAEIRQQLANNADPDIIIDATDQDNEPATPDAQDTKSDSAEENKAGKDQLVIFNLMKNISIIEMRKTANIKQMMLSVFSDLMFLDN